MSVLHLLNKEPYCRFSYLSRQQLHLRIHYLPRKLLYFLVILQRNQRRNQLVIQLVIQLSQRGTRRQGNQHTILLPKPGGALSLQQNQIRQAPNLPNHPRARNLHQREARVLTAGIRLIAGGVEATVAV